MVTAPAPERFGSYLVYELVGKGGMATVHRAERVNKDGSRTEVALKRLLPPIAANRHLVDAFTTEARLLEYLDHSNIARTFEHGKVVGDAYFMAMEFVRGKTLKQLFEECGKQAITIPDDIALDIAAQVCDALDYAHNASDGEGRPLGIIHRDVCPANIILADNGYVKLIDFGLAKVRATRMRKEDTGKRVIKGKFNYVAPEYIDGELDARADLWALGVVLYELVTNRRLFNGADDLETISRVRRLPIPRPSLANPRASGELDDIVLKALQRDPRKRWKSAAAMGEALRVVIDQHGSQVSHRSVADWLASVYEEQPGVRRSQAAIERRLAQNTPVVSFPVEVKREQPSGPTRIADALTRGAKRLLKRKDKA